jgi:hypothetical protein
MVADECPKNGHAKAVPGFIHGNIVSAQLTQASALSMYSQIRFLRGLFTNVGFKFEVHTV